MTKQDEIKNGIADILEVWMSRDLALTTARTIMAKEAYQGVVIKIDGELHKVICLKKDECGYKHNCTHAVDHQDSWELCRHYSYNPCSCPKERVAVEPLIEEKLSAIKEHNNSIS